MGHDNRELLLGLWSLEDDVVPIASTVVANGSINGGRTTASAKTARLARQSPGDFTPERILRSPTRTSDGWWRRLLSAVSGGALANGPSRSELRERELIAEAKTPITGCRKVAFISRKGGVGKTTTCLLAGHTFATHRGDRVIALDGNPDGGTLGHRMPRETTANLTSLLTDAARIERYADIRGYTSQASSRLEVVASDDDPRITQAIGESEVGRAIELIERHYNLVCLDTGTGVLDAATRGVLNAADQIVVISAPSLDGARAASSTLDWLEANGHSQLAAGAVAVLNGVRRRGGLVDLDRIESHFADRCRAFVRIPWDAHLETGAEAALAELRPETVRAYLELAAAIASGFHGPTERRT